VISVQRYFLETSEITNNKAIIEGQDFHHIKHVMRMKKGDKVVICDRNSHCYLSEITDFDMNVCVLKTIQELPKKNKTIHIDIAQSLIKKDAFETVIQKSTELGARSLIPLKAKNSIVKIDDKKIETKLNRWNTIAKEASEQSERNTKALVQKPLTIQELPFDQYDYVIVMYARGKESNISADLLKNGTKLLLLIGPEGGFDSKEITFLNEQSNAILFTIPNRILRSETASMYMLSVLDYLSEIGD
jgi:16S rRNA (uracil1498-N3)-methyltransferase